MRAINRARATSWPRQIADRRRPERLRVAQLVPLARWEGSRCVVPSSTWRDVRWEVDATDPDNITCTCPSRVPCRHVAAALISLAGHLLELEGEPDSQTIQHALDDLDGGQLLRWRYFCDANHAPRYGYAPMYRTTKFRLGLSPLARRDLSPLHLAALGYVLGAMFAEVRAREESDAIVA